jgi:hypothetical protein
MPINLPTINLPRVIAMSDELDPQLLRLFAKANEPLSDADFHARVMARVQRPSGWRGIAQATASTLLSICSGVVLGVAAPFRQRGGMFRLLAIGVGALVSCLAVLTA